MGLLLALRRHPLPIAAHFEFSLVLTYAFPGEVLASLLPPGLEPDLHGDLGFVAVTLVQTHNFRPAFLPTWCGLDFFLTDYRVFVRYRTADGRVLRGLFILRSDTDCRLMQCAGNTLTHYHYRHAEIGWRREGGRLHLNARTPGAVADLDLTAFVDEARAPLPPTTPFSTWREARRFIAPMPFTFDYEAASNSFVLVEGVHTHWQPRPVRVAVNTLTFFDQPPFAAAGAPRLAHAFVVESVQYAWRRGIQEAGTPLAHALPASVA